MISMIARLDTTGFFTVTLTTDERFDLGELGRDLLAVDKDRVMLSQ